MTEKKKEDRIGVNDSDIVTIQEFGWLRRGSRAKAEEQAEREDTSLEKEAAPAAELDEAEGEEPAVHPRKKRRAAKEGLPRGWQRVTWVVRDEYAETLRALSAWTGEEIKDILDVILEGYFSRPDIEKVVKKALEFARSRRETLEDLKIDYR